MPSSNKGCLVFTKGMPYMDTRYSDKANDLARKKDQLAVAVAAVAAEAYRDDDTPT